MDNFYFKNLTVSAGIIGSDIAFNDGIGGDLSISYNSSNGIINAFNLTAKMYDRGTNGKWFYKNIYFDVYVIL